jgi:type IX secretion system PorP/SprF family membrane protein
MKKHFFAILIILNAFVAFAQESPFYRHYFFDQTLLNPAIGAKYDYLSIKMTATDQWINLPNNPQTAALSVNSKFAGKMGLNVAVLTNKYGVINNSGLKISYFYYTRLNVLGDYISYGIEFSGFQYSFNTNGFIINNNDPAIVNKNFSALYPNAGLGIYYHTKIFSTGFSAGNLLPYKPRFFNDTLEPNKVRRYFFYADTRITNEINTFAVIPSIMFNIDEKFKREINLNTKIIFNNMFWLGLSYRDALSTNTYDVHNILTMIGFKFFKRLNIAYGYDVGILSVRSVLGGTHTILIGYDFIKGKKDVPMFF